MITEQNVMQLADFIKTQIQPRYHEDINKHLDRFSKLDLSNTMKYVALIEILTGLAKGNLIVDNSPKPTDLTKTTLKESIISTVPDVDLELVDEYIAKFPDNAKLEPFRAARNFYNWYSRQIELKANRSQK